MNGFLDGIAVNAITRYEQGLLSELRSKHADVLKGIRETKDLGDDLKGKLNDAVAAFTKTFA